MSDNQPSVQTGLRSAKVDMLSTKDNDMKRRRTINAAPAKDKNDYVILDQLDQAVNELGGEVETTNTSLTQLATAVFINRNKYGTHANRLNISPATVDSSIYIETNRSNVIYQAQKISGGSSKWIYLVGTMWGTMSPDNRPTDLGIYDSGFNYRSTDNPPRQFFWSGTVWVEVNPIQAAIVLPTGGTVIDVQSRNSITDISNKLRALGLTF